MWHDNATHVIDNFDWTVCQFATECEDIIYNPLGLIDLFNNSLRLHRVSAHMDSLYRLCKYLKKGYKATADTLDKLTQDIVEARVANPDARSPVRRGTRRAQSVYPPPQDPVYLSDELSAMIRPSPSTQIQLGNSTTVLGMNELRNLDIAGVLHGRGRHTSETAYTGQPPCLCGVVNCVSNPTHPNFRSL